jgi:hypothetical protein
VSLTCYRDAEQQSALHFYGASVPSGMLLRAFGPGTDRKRVRQGEFGGWRD